MGKKLLFSLIFGLISQVSFADFHLQPGMSVNVRGVNVTCAMGPQVPLFTVRCQCYNGNYSVGTVLAEGESVAQAQNAAVYVCRERFNNPHLSVDDTGCKVVR